MTQCPSEKRFVGTVSSAPEGWRVLARVILILILFFIWGCPKMGDPQ